MIDKQRNIVFDALKAFAIWCVVLGHCIQDLSGLEWWNNGLFRFIYSFHMPLFFMISGFFFASSIKLGWLEFLRKKTLSLILPCFVWGVVEAVARFDSWSQLIADILLPTHWPFWFFKGLFLVQVFVYATMRLTARIGGANIRVCSLIFLSLLVYTMPYMAVPRVMLPIFWIGYVMKMKYEQFVTYHRVIGIVAIVLFVGLYYFWNAEAMRYSASASLTIYHVLLGKHGYTGMNLLMLAYRILLATAGSVAIIAAMHEVKNVNKYISVIGASTAGIFILQTYILQYGMRWLFDKYVDLKCLPLFSNYMLMLIISIAVTGLITWLYQLLRKIEWIDLILFGCGKYIKGN